MRAVAVPPSAMAQRTLARVDYADAYAVALPPGAPRDPEQVAEAVFHRPPAWVLAAMGLRNAIVAPLGLKAPRSARRGFPMLDRDDHEVLLGLDDRHLDFRVSVHVEGATAVVATRVQIHGALGRAYFAPVRLVHPVAVRAMLTRAAHRLSRRSHPVAMG